MLLSPDVFAVTEYGNCKFSALVDSVSYFEPPGSLREVSRPAQFGYESGRVLQKDMSADAE